MTSSEENDSETLLPAFMDRQLGNMPTPQSVSSEHDEGIRLAEAFRDADAANSFVAALAWTVALENQRGLAYALPSGFPSISQTADRLVVRHANGQGYSLLVLDPTHSGSPAVARVSPETLSYTIDVERAYSRRNDYPEIEAGVNLYRHGILISPDALRLSVHRFYRDQGYIVVARRPELIPTKAQPLVVEDSLSGSVQATVGAVATLESGETVGTTALHAVADVSTVSIAGLPADVVSRHEPTDSCVFSLGSIPWEITREHRRVPLELSPRLFAPAKFTGAARKDEVSTMITAIDPSLAISQTMFTTKVYTNPDTLPGDSGAALTDEQGRVIGFAAWRTGFSAEINFAIWIWAQQVFAAHKLRTLR